MPLANLVERYSPPLHEMESLPVKEVICTPAGETVLDFGQNFAGYVECQQVFPKGLGVKCLALTHIYFKITNHHNSARRKASNRK